MERFFLMHVSDADMPQVLSVLLGYDGGPPMASSLNSCPDFGAVIEGLRMSKPVEAIIVSLPPHDAIQTFLKLVRREAPLLPVIVFADAPPVLDDPYVTTVSPSHIATHLRPTIERLLRPLPAAS